ncbi:MAG: type II secretion system F family protein [Firmicutes bacterium]|nr:type II secretion system F family protein [Bacillota bacterium]
MAAWAVVLWALAAAAAVLGLRARRRAWLIRQVTAAAPVRPREDPDFAGSFLDRLGALTWRRWTRGLSRRLLPSAARRQLEHRLRLAGSARTPEAFFAGRLVLALVGAVAGAGLGLLEAHGAGALLGAGAGTAFGYLWPGVHLNTQVQQRRRALLAELPEVFDLLATAMRAGLSFDAALRRIVSHLRGPAAEVFGRLVQQLQVGVGRQEALEEAARRTDLPLLTQFAAMVAQASATGGSLSDILEALARTGKAERLGRVREAAARLPVVLLFPMVAFILPALFIVLLGPAVMAILPRLGSL